MSNQGVNIIDPDSVTMYLHSLAEDPDVLRWLNEAMKRFILKRRENAIELTELPPNAPAWLQNKWDISKGPFHAFHVDGELDQKMRHIRDWLVAAKQNNETFLKACDDKGRPIRLMSIKSIDEAYRLADDYGKNKYKNIKDKEENLRTVMTFPDGSRIVEMLTTDSLDYETSRMGHCVGKGGYDQALAKKETRLYSLRDQYNNPHATLEVRVKDNALVQCKGKQNVPPVEKYMPMITAFINREKFKLRESSKYTGLVQDARTGAVYSIFDMPDDLMVVGTLNLSDRQDITKLPKNLTVLKGNLLLAGCNNLVDMPQNLFVGGRLEMEDCINVEVLPEILTIESHLSLNNCTKISALPDGISVKGSLYARGCTALKYLPETHAIMGCSDVNAHIRVLDLRGCTALEKLPENFFVSGALNLSDCTKLKFLPWDMTVQGDLFLRGCTGLTSLPETLTALGDIDLSGCTNLLKLPEGLIVRGRLHIKGCTELKALPKTLKVRDRLYIDDTMKIKSIPETIKTTWRIHLNGVLFDSDLPPDNTKSVIQAWGDGQKKKKSIKKQIKPRR